MCTPIQCRRFSVKRGGIFPPVFVLKASHAQSVLRASCGRVLTWKMPVTVRLRLQGYSISGSKCIICHVEYEAVTAQDRSQSVYVCVCVCVLDSVGLSVQMHLPSAPPPPQQADTPRGASSFNLSWSNKCEETRRHQNVRWTDDPQSPIPLFMEKLLTTSSVFEAHFLL